MSLEVIINHMMLSSSIRKMCWFVLELIGIIIVHVLPLSSLEITARNNHTHTANSNPNNEYETENTS